MKTGFLERSICAVTLVAFVLTSVAPSFAQSALQLPQPGTMVTTTAVFAPAVLQGMRVYPDESLRFDFIIDTGNDEVSAESLQGESTKLIRYFLASLTTPEKDLWVNLSPYEGDRIIVESFGETEMGRDLLAQDYILKQITSSLIYPESESGKAFWAQIYQKVYEKYGTTDIPVDTFNKVWITPDEATVFVNGQTAVIKSSHLKVMLESDYVAQEGTRHTTQDTRECSGASNFSSSAECRVSSVSSAQELAKSVLREVVIPIIEKEVNEGRNFAQLRQIYRAMVLATWFKRNLKESLVGRTYTDQNKVKGIDLVEKGVKDEIWQQYVAAFKKGVFNYIKEETEEMSGELIPRKYFSGGFVDRAEVVREVDASQNMMVDAAQTAKGKQKVVSVKLDPVSQDKTSAFDFPPVTDPQVLKILKQKDPRRVAESLKQLAELRKELIPQILTILMKFHQDLDSTTDNYYGRFVYESLDYYWNGFYEEHPALSIHVLAILGRDGNASARFRLKNFLSTFYYKEALQAVSLVIQLAKKNDQKALYAVAVLLEIYADKVWPLLDGLARKAVLQFLAQEPVERHKDREASFWEWVIKKASGVPVARKAAVENLIRMADNGDTYASAVLMKNPDAFAKLSQRGKEVVKAGKMIRNIQDYFDFMLSPNGVVTGETAIRMSAWVKAQLTMLAFKLSKDAKNVSKALANYGSWPEYRIFRPLVWPEKVREHIFKNRIANAAHKPLISSRPGQSKGRAIVVYPWADWNGAFTESKVIEQLIDEGYEVLYYEAGSVRHLIGALVDATRDGKTPLSFAIIGGHGTPQSIEFGHGFRLNEEVLSDFGKLGKYFKRGARGIAESCSTGQKLEGAQRNMVQVLSKVTGIEFAGPDRSSSLIKIDFKSGNHLWGHDARNSVAGPDASQLDIVQQVAVGTADALGNLAGSYYEGIVGSNLYSLGKSYSFAILATLAVAFSVANKVSGLVMERELPQELGAAQQEDVQRLEATAGNTLDAAETLKGGIDLNSDNLRLLEMGEKMKFAPSADAAALSGNIDGFIPVVLGIVPLVDPQAFFAGVKGGGR